MKTATKLLMATLALVFLRNQTNAQSTQTGLGPLGHLGTVAATDYLGWQNPTIPLFFRTNYAVATAGLGNRMIITNGAFGPLNGRIAMGNNLPDAFAPVDRLHLNQNTGTTAIRLYK